MEVLLDHYTPSVSLQMLLNSLGDSLGPPNMPHLRLTREQLKNVQASVEGVILQHTRLVYDEVHVFGVDSVNVSFSAHVRQLRIRLEWRDNHGES